MHITPTAATDTPQSIGFSDDAGLLSASSSGIAAQLDAMKNAGAKRVRVSVAWNVLQPTQATFNWTPLDNIVTAARSRSLSVLGIIGYTPSWAAAGTYTNVTSPPKPALFGTFANAVAARYKGKISAYEIWNEPNGAMFYSPAPDPAGYTALVKAAYTQIKSADSSATVIAGALGSAVTRNTTMNPVEFLSGMYTAGAANYFDAISFHPYQYDFLFAAGMTVADSPVQQARDLYTTMSAKGDGAKKIWLTEYGVPSTAVDDARQNEMITNLMVKWQEVPYAGPIYIFELRDKSTGSSDAENTFGLMNSDGTAKASYIGYSWVQQHGIPLTDEANRFAKASTTGLGTVLSPVFPVSGIWAQQFTGGWLWEVSSGSFLTSPTAVGTKMLTSGLIPTTAFANGYQDFNSPYGLRCWYSAATGAHIAGGGIVSVWTSSMGLATSDETALTGGGVKVTFQNGYITWTPTAGAKAYPN
ncbi:cellulase family glycosylhydrolase [Williamsia sterculiae]|uniref:cellulase family glycosylhydrolase n=1 Tax=Williamsia sterculiae TaxID=1344003 RepID=UPI001356712D|nr:cellulase family glycosylhydrolase [Williamsia sterculiae]